MEEKLLHFLKNKLEEEKALLEKELSRFAQRDPKIKDNWKSKFPQFERRGERKEESADEVEEYATRLPIEYHLELKLRDVNLALEKIKKGNYGICEKCGKEIDKERLKAYPSARFCTQCQKENARENLLSR